MRSSWPSLALTVNLPNLFAAGTALASTRVTEGFGGPFQPRSTGEDNGTRFLIRYSGFPANTHLYLPDAVAGSDALTPTAGGDLGYRQQAGQYIPGRVVVWDTTSGTDVEARLRAMADA